MPDMLPRECKNGLTRPMSATEVVINMNINCKECPPSRDRTLSGRKLAILSVALRILT